MQTKGEILEHNRPVAFCLFIFGKAFKTAEKLQQYFTGLMNILGTEISWR